jgi:hypothetical protein
MATDKIDKRGIWMRTALWITDGQVNKRVQAEKLHEFIDAGWRQGYTSAVGKNNTAWITNGTENKKVLKTDVAFYIEHHGFKRGITSVNNSTATCPHCGKTGGHMIMRRWHFGNCPKLKA